MICGGNNLEICILYSVEISADFLLSRVWNKIFIWDWNWDWNPSFNFDKINQTKISWVDEIKLFLWSVFSKAKLLQVPSQQKTRLSVLSVTRAKRNWDTWFDPIYNFDYKKVKSCSWSRQRTKVCFIKSVKYAI